MLKVIMMAALALATAADGAAASTESLEKQLIQQELEWSKATVVHTPGVVERLLADDYVGTDGRGIISNKADEIEEAKAPDPSAPPNSVRVVAETITDFKVRIFGDVGIVNGRTIQQTERAGVPGEVQFRRTTVWVKRGSQWQCVSFHGSRLQSPPPATTTK